MAVVASGFLSRPPDSLALRNWAQVRDDPRGRHHQSYNPLHRSAHSSAGRHKHELKEEDPLASAQVGQLQHEVVQARAEIQQLRSALHYAGLALQGVGNWDKLPEELRAHLNQHHRMVDDLLLALRERDQEIATLTGQKAQHEKQLLHHRHVLMSSISKWTDPLLLAWRSWEKLMTDVRNEKYQEAAFQKALSQIRSSMKPTVLRSFQGLAEKDAEILCRLIFQGWNKLAQDARRESDKQKHQAERVKTLVQMWAGNRRGFGLRICWSGWIAVLAEKEAKLREEELRKQHLEDAKKAKKESVMRSTLLLADGNEKNNKYVILQMFFRVLLEHKTESQIRRKMDEEVNREKKMSKEMEERRVHRQVLLVMNSGSKMRLSTAFLSWQDLWKTFKHKQQLKQEGIKLDYKKDVMHIWMTVFKNGAKAREIKKLRQKLEEDEKKRQKEQFHQKIELITISWAGRKAPKLLLQYSWSAWKEEHQKMLREKEKLEWAEQWEMEEAKRNQTARARMIAVSMNRFNPDSEESRMFLLKMSFFAWKDIWKELKRYQTLDNEQRLMEDDLARQRDELTSLAAEKKGLEERHHKAHLTRLGGYMFFQDRESAAQQELLLRIVWKSWCECVQDLQDEVKKMRGEISDYRQAHNPGCFHRWLSRCCCCCPCRCCKKYKMEHGAQVAPVDALSGWEEAYQNQESEKKRGTWKQMSQQGKQKRGRLEEGDLPIKKTPSTGDSPNKKTPSTALQMQHSRDVPTSKDAEGHSSSQPLCSSSQPLLSYGEHSIYYYRLKVTAIFFYIAAAIIIVPTVLSVIVVLLNDACVGALYFRIIFFASLVVEIFICCCTMFWLIGAAKIANPHFVLASRYYKRTQEGDDQFKNYIDHLTLATTRADLGRQVCRVCNVCLNIGVLLVVVLDVLFVILCLIPFVNHEACIEFKIWSWLGLYVVLFLWALAARNFPNLLKPPI